MNRLNLLLATSLVAVTAAAHADTVINLNATANPSISTPATAQPPFFFSTQSLAAGTYSVTLIDNTANGGYNGWSQSETNGMPSANSWQERVGIDLNTAANDFSETNGVPSYNYSTDNAANPEAFTGLYSSAAAAFAAQSGGVYTFTLASAANVTFYIPDQPDTTQPNGQPGYYPGFTDNAGGVSLDVKAVTPEPSSLILLGTGAMGLAGAVRRRFKK